MNRRRDSGAVLPLVLVIVVIGALIVVPLMNYSMSVLRANEVQSERTRVAEAAKAGIRVVLGDPADVFARCNDSADLTPVNPVIDGIPVSVTCTEIDETGPLEVLGFQIPYGAVAMQLGARVPTSFSGTTAQSDPVPPYPADAAWWSGQVSSAAVTDMIWLPQLPVHPSVTRSSTPFAMPAGFACSVYLPGYYPDPVSVTGNVYFASGVYYFEDTVTVEGNADVVVGQGVEDFGTDCADDIQVASNVLGSPGTFAIDGGGGTWIFGDNGNLVVDNSTTTTSLSIRFNQRYADVAQGGRISIMSVNGDDTAPVDHTVDNVSSVPRSTVLTSTGSVLALGDTGAEYLPSSSTFTDQARLPQPPTVSSAVGVIDWSSSLTGAALVTWDAVTGQAAGGALVDGFEVTVTPTPSGPAPCQSTDIVPEADGTFSCLIRRLTPGVAYDITVAARNWVGAGGPSPATSVTPPLTPSSGDLVGVPDAPQIDTVVAATADDTAVVSWLAPATGGAPIVAYEAKAYHVYLDPPVDPDPAVEHPPVEVGNCSTSATTWEPAMLSCAIGGLSDLTQPEDVGYRFSVTATNALGESTEVIVDPPGAPVLSFDGGGIDPVPTPLVRVVEPWMPQPIVDVKATNDVATTVSIAGHVAVPMGRLSIDNPHGRNIKMNGGLVAGTFSVADSRENLAVAGSLPLGFKNDIVLQREVRLVSTAGNMTSVAIAKINEDGAAFALSAWVTQ